MNLLKKNIGICILVGVFLQPHIFNNLHFLLVAHDHEFNSENSGEFSLHSTNTFHNCEQYLFKVPPTTEINLAQAFKIQFTQIFKEKIESESKILIQNLDDFFPTRGPPDYFGLHQ